MIGFETEYASLSDVGVRRSHNQDSHALLPALDLEQWQNRGHVFLVADGMGGHAVGELASKIAADSIPHIYSKYALEGAAQALEKAFVEANLLIHMRGQQNPEFHDMGTTATALLLRPEGAWIGHVGDSRVYRVRQGKIEQLSFDHSQLWEMARRLGKKPEELKGIPPNVILRSLGHNPAVQVDIEGPHPLLAGDIFILCSDGLSGPVSDREIGAAAGALTPDEACRFLVQLANVQGGPDNITAIVVRVGKAPARGPTASLAKTGFFSKVVIPDWLQHFWPYVLLFLGIGLGLTAILLHIQEMAGELPAFLLAALAVLGGWAGVMMQGARERRERELPQPKQSVYRRLDCTIEDSFLRKLTQADSALEEKIREKNWQADWDSWKRHIELSKKAAKQGEVVTAFREQCRALLVLMEAIHQQRGKEESFKPLWDKAPA